MRDLTEESERQRQFIQDLSEQLAEAQADITMARVTNDQLLDIIIDLRKELEQLQKVRDELLNYRKYASVWCDLNENHAWQRVEQALAQAKAGEADEPSR